MTTHMLRPGPIRGTQVLCEPQEVGKDDYMAELSKRGLAQVTCDGCKHILNELARIMPRGATI